MSQRDDDGGAGPTDSWDAPSWQETRLVRRDSAHEGDVGDDAALDALLRRSMRSLDERVPDALFDELPAKVDARLTEGGGAAEGADVADEDYEPPAVRSVQRHQIRTEVVGPHAWWHSRGMVIGVGLASVVAAAALIAVVARRGASESPAMGASSIREPGSRRVGAARQTTAELEEPDAVELERRAVLAELAPVLPEARACVGARPAAPISLDLTVSPEGVIRDVVVQGPLPELAAARCIADAIHRLDGKLAPRERPQSVRVPLF